MCCAFYVIVCIRTVYDDDNGGNKRGCVPDCMSWVETLRELECMCVSCHECACVMSAWSSLPPRHLSELSARQGRGSHRVCLVVCCARVGVVSRAKWGARRDPPLTSV